MSKYIWQFLGSIAVLFLADVVTELSRGSGWQLWVAAPAVLLLMLRIARDVGNSMWGKA